MFSSVKGKRGERGKGGGAKNRLGEKETVRGGGGGDKERDRQRERERERDRET